ncbi:MAG: TraR/DksA C4-type zinc finger protein [Armatimonadetes bacterium]|nr:TraR/DksA C4-type zinc finger protein [Armatimonadota bacterium]
MAQNLDTNRYREMLDKERARMQHQMRATEIKESQSDALSELSDYDDHPADVANETFEREKERTLRGTARATLDRIEAALGKMERGTYGLCDICGKAIPPGRLDAVPYATLCVKCQADVEGP